MATPDLRAHWTLDPEVRFLNHGSFGACPRAVLDHQQAWRDRMEREPVAFLARALYAELDAARDALARFLGCAGAGLAFVTNATTGVNAVLRSLKLDPGDELVITNHGYNACNNAVRFVCERSGAVVREARIPFPIHSPDQAVAAIEAVLGPRTKLAVIDHITSPTGLVLPIPAIAEALAARGVDLLVDGAHAPGQLDLDLDALGVAYYTGNCHKWLCTPKGAAFLYVREDRRAQVRPLTISHGANMARPGHTRLQDEFDWPGTHDPSAWLSVPFAIDYLATLVPGGWPELRAHNRGLALAARDRLCATLGVAPPAPDEMIANLAALPLPPATAGEPASAFAPDPLQLRLFEVHRIEVPIVSWPRPPARLLRISAQLYNDLADYEALISALGREGALA
ncbi:aminotransferase class V-fold PLP-dependent enzyme [Pseudenhygromyxa sp. WMMC2535]|uniref:aminotransferase class V-fold PLP-dependent enzyme n=1 Tax=Pseudenhygromyxa sp. WMMC2535 TaxID=2712867 RepID=UPI0015563D24|nr:aminotransferase class V-fold PLP-dependent enzyme [Pseudenhygromyxa sp. WMMC2535]